MSCTALAVQCCVIMRMCAYKPRCLVRMELRYLSYYIMLYNLTIQSSYKTTGIICGAFGTVTAKIQKETRTQNKIPLTIMYK